MNRWNSHDCGDSFCFLTTLPLYGTSMTDILRVTTLPSLLLSPPSPFHSSSPLSPSFSFLSLLLFPLSLTLSPLSSLSPLSCSLSYSFPSLLPSLLFSPLSLTLSPLSYSFPSLLLFPLSLTLSPLSYSFPSSSSLFLLPLPPPSSSSFPSFLFFLPLLPSLLPSFPSPPPSPFSPPPPQTLLWTLPDFPDSNNPLLNLVPEDSGRYIALHCRRGLAVIKLQYHRGEHGEFSGGGKSVLCRCVCAF